MSNNPAAPKATSENQTNSTTTVIVGCKLPNGFLMELGTFGQDNYRAFKLNGLNTSGIINGFGITRGVPADFFAAWEKKMKGYKVIKNGLIFKVEGENNLVAVTKELKDLKTKLEPLNPKKLPKGVEKLTA